MKKRKVTTLVYLVIAAMMIGSYGLINNSSVIRAETVDNTKEENKNQTIAIDNKTTRLTNDVVEKIVKEIQGKIEKEYKDYSFKNYKAILIDARNDCNCVDLDIVVEMTLIKKPTEFSFYKGMVEAAGKLKNKQKRQIANKLIKEYLEEQKLYYLVPDTTTFCIRLKIDPAYCMIRNLFNNKIRNYIPESYIPSYTLYYRTDISDEIVDLVEEGNVKKYTDEELRQSGKESLLEDVNSIWKNSKK